MPVMDRNGRWHDDRGRFMKVAAAIAAIEKQARRKHTAGKPGSLDAITDRLFHIARRRHREGGQPAPLPRRGRPSRQSAQPASGTLGDLMRAIPGGFNDAHQDQRDARKRGVRDAIEGTHAGLTVRATSISPPSDNILDVQGEILDSNGEAVGSFHRMFLRDDDGKLVASHAFLKLDAHVQGSGFAREFNGKLFDWYRKSGVDRVEVEANIDVGGYTWATQGFDFNGDTSISDWIDTMRFKLSGMRGNEVISAWGGRMPNRRPGLLEAFPGLSEAQVDAMLDEFEALLDRAENGEPVSAYEFSQLGRKPGQGRTDSWIGKLMMLGSSWDGVLRL